MCGHDAWLGRPVGTFPRIRAPCPVFATDSEPLSVTSYVPVLT